MDLFLLDALSYRDRNDLSQNFTSSNKTLFGKEQLQWLAGAFKIKLHMENSFRR
jgi:phosphodiesterase/alkaline phosphatase D-like protein